MANWTARIIFTTQSEGAPLPSRQRHRRQNRILRAAVLATTAACGFAVDGARADPLVNVRMLGWDITQQGPAPSNPNSYGTVLDVKAGDTIVYAVLTYLSPTGTTNANPTADTSGQTINQTVNGIDGIQSLTFDSYQLASDQIQVDFKNVIPSTPTSSGGSSPPEGMSLFSGPGGNLNTKTQNWKGIIGASGGAAGRIQVSLSRSGGLNDMHAIRPGLVPGAFAGITSTQAAAALGTGLFVVDSLGTGAASVIKMRYTPLARGGSSGGFQYNNGEITNNLSDITEVFPFGDPYVGSIGLALKSTAAPVSIWSVDSSSSNWSDASKWTGGVPNGIGAVALLGKPNQVLSQISLDTPVTLGSLNLGNQASYSITGPAALTMASPTSANAVINVLDNPVGTTYLVQSPIVLANGTTVSTPVDLILSASISGPGELAMSGNGSLVLTGSNSYTGGTSLITGTVAVNSDSSLGGPTGSLRFFGGTLKTIAGINSARSIALDINNGIIDTTGFDSSLSGTISGGGTLYKYGTGTLVLGGMVNNAGGIAVKNGTIRPSQAQIFSPNTSISLNLGTVLDLGSLDQTLYSVRGDNFSGFVVLNGATLTLTGDFLQTAVTGSGHLVKSGNGVLVVTTPGLGPASSYSGSTTVTAGTLRAINPNALSPASDLIINAGATLELPSQVNQTIGSLGGQGRVSLFANTLTVGANQSSTTFGGVIADPLSGDSGNLTKVLAGSLTLSGTNTYHGKTTVQGGSLVVTGALQSPAATTVANASLVNDGLINGPVVANANGIVKGSGTFNNSITLNSGGTLSPGDSPGALTSAGGTLNSAGSYLFEIRDASGAPGIGADYWHILNQLNIASGSTAGTQFLIKPDTLDITNGPGFADNFDPNQTYHWILIQADSGMTGFSPTKFLIDSTSFLNPTNGGSFSISQSGTDLLLNFTPAVPEPASILLALPGGAILLLMRRRQQQRRDSI